MNLPRRTFLQSLCAILVGRKVKAEVKPKVFTCSKEEFLREFRRRLSLRKYAEPPYQELLDAEGQRNFLRAQVASISNDKLANQIFPPA